MNKLHIKLVGIAMLASIAISMNTAEPTAEQILKKAEQKLNATTIESELELTIKRPNWSKTMGLKTWGKGTDYVMAYLKSPAKDAGTVYLKTGNEVYNYLPKIKKTVKLPANLLSQNWMGTDMSTDDLVKLSKITSDYDATLAGSAILSGRDCYVILLLPKADASVLWGKMVLAIDKQDYIQMKTLFYDEDMELVNTVLSSDIKNMGGKMLASKMVMVPAGKKGQTTTIIYSSMKFDTPINESFFTKTNMPNVKP